MICHSRCSLGDALVVDAIEVERPREVADFGLLGEAEAEVVVLGAGDRFVDAADAVEDRRGASGGSGRS